MKIDFYDLFSLHTPKDFPEAGEENYITAAVKSRVMENIPAVKSKPVRISRIGRAVIIAAAAAVVLIMCTFAASALGLIDLERIFGGMFKSGTEHLAGITAVPQDVVTTGDDRLSLRVLGIGGTENEAFGAIEIKRNDGGVFPEHIRADDYGELNGVSSEWVVSNALEVIDETTAIYYFRNNTFDISTDDTLAGTTFTYRISQIVDTTELAKLQEKYDVYVDDEEDATYLKYLLENEDVILKGDWSVTFPLDYNVEERSISVNKPYSEHGITSSVITEVKLTAISLYVYIDDVYGKFGDIDRCPYYAVIKLDSGEDFTAKLDMASGHVEGGKPAVSYYPFDKPIDIESVESITIGDVVIPAK